MQSASTPATAPPPVGDRVATLRDELELEHELANTTPRQLTSAAVRLVARELDLEPAAVLRAYRRLRPLPLPPVGESRRFDVNRDDDARGEADR